MSASEVESFRLSQLANFGIVVNPQWTLASLQPEDIYVIAVEAVARILEPAASSAADAKQLNNAALLSWIRDNRQDDAATVARQAAGELRALPRKLPSAAKERFAACSGLALLARGVAGVPDHLDYSALMYPAEKASRELVAALVERLADHQDRLRAEAHAAANAAAAHQLATVSTDSVAAGFAGLRSRPVAAFQRPSARRFVRASAKAITTVRKADQVAATALHHNALRRLAGTRLHGGAAASGSAPSWVPRQRSTQQRPATAAATATDADVLHGALADAAPQQAAAAEREAAEVQARLRSAEANVAAMKMSVEDAARAREEADADVSTRLRELRAGIKLSKARVKAAKAEMEALEAEFLELDASEADDESAWEAAIAAVAARREVLDGVATGGAGFVASLAERLAELQAEHGDLLRDVESRLAKLRKKQQAAHDKIAALGPSKKEQLALLQTQCKALTRECRQKQEESESLAAELERSRARSKIKLDRGVLSKMIYDVTVRRHAKQEEHIRTIVNEIGISNRRIADLSAAIALRYGKIESDMYAEAKTDAGIRDLFLPLVGLRGEYVALVKRIEERGRARKETHDVESRLNKLMRFSDSAMLSSAERDLQLVRESIAATQAEIDAYAANAQSADI